MTQPTISVCVPYWDRQPALTRLFADYARLYSELPIEFSVCDDGSPTPARAPEDANVILTRLPAKRGPLNPCVPINAAVVAATGNIIVLTSPEVEHFKDAVLYEMLELLIKPMDYVVASCCDVTTSIWISGPKTNYTNRGQAGMPPGGHYHYLTMFSRTLWDKVGGFDEAYRHGVGCDDNDWAWRLYEAGADFKTITGTVWHHRTKRLKWKMQHNRSLFQKTWPKSRQQAAVTQREALV